MLEDVISVHLAKSRLMHFCHILQPTDLQNIVHFCRRDCIDPVQKLSSHILAVEKQLIIVSSITIVKCLFFLLDVANKTVITGTCLPPLCEFHVLSWSKRLECFVKQDPGRARQSS